MVEPGGGRRRKGHRLLYFFRTPPSVRVGREAIDPEAMRLLEQRYPDLSFDWSRLLRLSAPGSPGGAPGSGAPGSQAFPGSRNDRRRDRRERRGRPEPSPAPPTSAAVFDQHAGSSTTGAVSEFTEYPGETANTAAESAEYSEQLATEFLEETENGTDVEDQARGPIDDPAEPLEPVELVVPLEPVDPLEPVQHLEPLEPVELEPVELEPLEPLEPPPALPERYARLGTPGLERLRSRYADLTARLAAKTLPDEEREELTARAARLNPDAWLTDADVAAALEDYEAVFESLRAVVGRQPRRRL